ncbi:MAG: hypothetical protein ACYTKD_25975 [Planctomycetota bacterium]|jgi:hypothetical protein
MHPETHRFGYRFPDLTLDRTPDHPFLDEAESDLRVNEAYVERAKRELRHERQFTESIHPGATAMVALDRLDDAKRFIGELTEFMKRSWSSGIPRTGLPPEGPEVVDFALRSLGRSYAFISDIALRPEGYREEIVSMLEEDPWTGARRALDVLGDAYDVVRDLINVLRRELRQRRLAA